MQPAGNFSYLMICSVLPCAHYLKMRDGTFFTKLPTNLGRTILSEWLSTISLAKLDSAHCGRELRAHFLDLLANLQTSDQSFFGDSAYARLSWLTRRNIKCTYLQLCRVSLLDMPILLRIFLDNSDCLKQVHIKNCDDDGTKEFFDIIASNNCLLTHLTLASHPFRLRNSPSSWEEPLRKVLLCSADVLSEFSGPSGDWKTILAEGIQLRVLCKLSLRINCDQDLLCVSRSAPNLREVTLHSPVCSDVGFAAIGEFCSKLESFTVWRVDRVVRLDEGLTALAMGCRKLTYFLLQMCANFSDIGLGAIATYCTELSNITLIDANHITDAGLIEFAHGGKRLNSLTLHRCAAVTGACLEAVAQHCSSLQSLALMDLNSLCPDKLKVALSKFQNLQELTLSSCNVDDGHLELIAMNNPLLESLDISSSTYNILPLYTSAGLIKIALQCEQLKFFDLGTGSPHVSTLTAVLWEKMRPGLKIYPHSVDHMHE